MKTVIDIFGEKICPYCNKPMEETYGGTFGGNILVKKEIYEIFFSCKTCKLDLHIVQSRPIQLPNKAEMGYTWD